MGDQKVNRLLAHKNVRVLLEAVRAVLDLQAALHGLCQVHEFVFGISTTGIYVKAIRASVRLGLHGKGRALSIGAGAQTAAAVVYVVIILVGAQFGQLHEFVFCF